MNLSEFINAAVKRRHRAIVFIDGQESWALSAYKHFRSRVVSPSLILSNRQKVENTENASAPDCNLHHHSEDRVVPASKFRSVLGAQSTLLVWDLFEHINPDALAASSGTLEGGGVLIVLADSTTQYRPSQQRILDKLKSCSACFTLTPLNFEHEVNGLHPLTLNDSSKRVLTLTEDQKSCIEAVVRVAKGHRHRPLIISADRGRGKSTTLGAAAAELITHDMVEKVIVVCDRMEGAATLKDAFHYFAPHYNPEYSASHARLEFWPSDRLLAERPETHLLLVDEAASFSLSTLNAILSQYARVVLASTLHGYEGSGRGFELKLQTCLDNSNKKPNYHALTHPIRWADVDPLEAWINQTFVLDADIAQALTLTSKSSFQWVDGKALILDEPLLRKVFALLVLAHYQTRPSDLAHLLDDPDVSIGIQFDGNEVVAVVICIDESTPCRQDPQLAEAIINGKRRLKGKLLPQSLAMFYADKEWLNLRLLRVMRIVVHPNIQRQGVGVELLNRTQLRARENQFDGCSVSFGIEATLLNFWQGASYQPLRLGYRPDASSSLPSLMLVRPITTQCEQLIEQHQHHFYTHLLTGLASYYRDLAAADLKVLLQHLDSSLCAANTLTHSEKPRALSRYTLTTEDKSKLTRFAGTAYAQWDVWVELQRLILASCRARISSSNTEFSELIEYVLLPERSKSVEQRYGKKIWERKLREAVADLLNGLEESAK